MLVFVALCRVSVDATSEDYSLVVAHRLNFLKACGILSDQGLNHSCLHCKVDSYALDSPKSSTLVFTFGNRIPTMLGPMESSWR